MKVPARVFAGVVCVFVLVPSTSAAEPSLAEIKIAADKGDAEAQEKLGDAFVSRLDGKQSSSWYRKAAQSGRPTAQAKLGNQLLLRSRMGTGVKAAEREAMGAEALTWIRQAAVQGIPRAQADLGDVLLEGKIAKQDLVEAYKWGELASKGPASALETTVARTVRDAAVLKMTPGQIAEAKKRVAAFVPGASVTNDFAVGQIKLKGINGVGAKRLALINNVNLAQGEVATIKLGERSVSVRCLEIRDSSVMVTVEGVQGARELVLGAKD